MTKKNKNEERSGKVREKTPKPVQEAPEISDSSDRTGRALAVIAAHPYLCVFALCMAITPFCFGSLRQIPGYTVPVALAVLIAAAAAFIWDKCRRHKLPVVSTVLIMTAVTAALALGANYFNNSDYRILWIFLVGCIVLSMLYGALYAPKYRRQFNSALIIGLSFLLKFCYMLGTPVDKRQHDIGYFSTSETTGGHLGYISYLYNNHSLYPEDYRKLFQFCHPPFHHGICAVWVAVWKDLFHVGQEKAIESLQMLPLFYSMCILISAYFILRYFKLDGKALYISLMIVAFHPCFTFLSALLNNDALMWALVTGAVLTTLRWYSEPTLKRIMKISLCVGLGMMTKVSAALVAPPIALVFLIVFIRDFKSSWKKLVGQFAAFGAVCVPLGMWFPVRGLIKWGIPLNYVQELSENLSQNIRDLPFLGRITNFSPEQYKRVFENWAWRDENGVLCGVNESNPLIAIFKNSIFSEHIGEDDFPDMGYMLVLCKVLFWLGVVLAAFAFIAMILTFIRDRSMDRTQKLFIGSFYALLVGNLYLMSANYPMVCTMNFRYLMPTVITGALFIGMFIKRKNSKTADTVLNVSATTFSVISALVYLVVSQNT